MVYAVYWYDTLTDVCTYTEVWDRFSEIEDAIAEARILTRSNEYFRIYNAEKNQCIYKGF